MPANEQRSCQFGVALCHDLSFVGMTLPATQSERALGALERFHAAALDDVLAERTTREAGERALALFHEVSKRVPAYRAFLAARGVAPEAVRTLADFSALPTTSKHEYHQPNRLAELCRDGDLTTCDIVAVSSGSTGEPTVWPRFVSDEVGTAFRFEQVLADSFRASEKRTLGVVCFALGSWVGGMYTTAACRHLAAKGYPLTLVTPGNQRAEILRVVRALGPSFEQTILFGYPPFLKDVIDAGRADGVDWQRYGIKLVTAGEVFSESWRSLVCERAGSSDPLRDSASLYGTADGGVLANETPLSIAIRRFLAARPEAARELFGEARLPTLCQYDPCHRYFETVGDELVFTGDGGVPLVRYRILDRGGVVQHAKMLEFLRDHGFDPARELPKATERRALPFVFVFGRGSFALSFYGANVYPENVSIGLEQRDLAAHVTGKFVVEVATSADENSELLLTVELAANARASTELELELARSVRAALERSNSEFLAYVPEERRAPRVRLLPLGEPEYFPSGVKHRYTRTV
jgi:phenylacetate-coenzyme A ligase PaaK-like adenylate-forming protein